MESPFNRSRASQILVVLAPTAACYGPNADYLGVDETGAPTSDFADDFTTDIADDSTTTATETTDASTSAEADSSDADTSTDSGTTDTGVDPSCGNGTVEPGEFCFEFVEILATLEVQALATGDFDDDGDIDLAVARKDDVLVLMGDGTGDFPLHVDLPEIDGNYFGAAAGDLDADSRDDLVVANADADAVFVYRSLGGGNFAIPVEFPVGGHPHGLVLASLDDDAAVDLAVTLTNVDAVEIRLGDGVGGFGPPTTFASGGDQPLELDFGTLDAGNSFDLAVGNYAGSQLAILHDATPGQFTAPVVHPLPGKPRSVGIADFDLDGQRDVAAVLEDADEIALLYGDGNGNLLDPLMFAVGDAPVGALTEDLDNDGAPDLLILNFGDPSVGVLFNSADTPGAFTPEQTLGWFDGFANMSTTLAADLDDDGVSDVVIGGDGVRVMLSDP